MNAKLKNLLQILIKITYILYQYKDYSHFNLLKIQLYII